MNQRDSERESVCVVERETLRESVCDRERERVREIVREERVCVIEIVRETDSDRDRVR